jgi:hypothetical protein
MSDDEEYGFFRRWDAQKRPSQPPPVNGVAPSTAYARAALEAELSVLLSTREGDRNDQLNKSGYALYQLVAAGALSEGAVDGALTDAASFIGLTDSETVRTIRSAKAGLAHPRIIEASPTVTDPPPVTVLTDSDDADDRTELEIWRARKANEELERQRAFRAARAILDHEENAAAFRQPPYTPDLAAELALPDEDTPYTIEALLPAGGNILLTAQYKTGKTTLIDNLAASLADHTPFLTKFAVHPAAGRVAIFNYENDRNTYRRWLRDTPITNPAAITVLNLRGYRMPLTTPNIQAWITNWLADHHIHTWIIDPFARAYTGSGRSENDNTEVGAFLDTLDVIKHDAGVANLVLPTHTGRDMIEGDERARGATRLDDWADVRWLLTKDDNGTRYLSATGRDVDVAEEKLQYHQATRTLTFGGGNRSWEKRIRLEDAVTQITYNNPGITLRGIRDAVAATEIKARTEAIGAAVEGAIRGHRIRVEKVGGSTGNKHYSTEIRAIGESNT